jgi:Xaa-Pro dipeptidase
MNGVNSDSGNEYLKPTTLNYSLLQKSGGGTTTITIDTETLYPIIAECRVIKSDTELYLLRYVTEVTSFGHAYVMRNFCCHQNENHQNTTMYEYQGESLFRHYCYYNYGCRLVGYTPICGCGPNSAILHYGHSGRPNSDPTTSENTICLFDMGIEYFHYGSDVTCSFPSNGTFTTKQRRIYEGVLNAQITVYNMMRPGVSWVDCHKAAEATILQALVDIGIVRLSPSSEHDTIDAPTKTVEELVEMRLGAVFMPHGLGHFIGLDTHDVGGYLEGHPPRIALPGLRKLRTARVLQSNMVLTVEPGCYFIHHLLDEAMAENHILRPYMNKYLINNEYRNFGGIRLEDVVQVTENGIINYTLCPRTVAEVENVCTRQMQWPPLRDVAPELRRLRLLDTKPLPSPPSL